MRKLLVFVLAVALLGVVGDRVAHHLVTNEAEKRLRAQGLSDPSVEVTGFPFLTQLLARRFDQVRVAGPALTRDRVRAKSVSATATDVHVPQGGRVVVGTITARGTISYTEVLRQAGQRGLTLRRASGDEVTLRREITVLGQTVAVSARGRVEADGRRIRVVPRGLQLQGGGAVSPPLAASLTDRLSLTYPVRGLPRGVRIDRITAADDGFVVTLSGHDVTLSDTAAAARLRQAPLGT
ncbi:MAG: hypothetical protein QOI54_2566 [Actinomycetota bacterium]|jgi:hypothetical protein|nr:hypothetical protein [Actinomycetota bacterium]